MTWLVAFASFASGAAVVGGVWWAATALKVFDRQPDPFDVPHGWEGDEP